MVVGTPISIIIFKKTSEENRMDNKVLGKGLAALIPERSDFQKSESVAHLKTSLIKDNRLQPRAYYDEEKLKDLIASIKEKGVLQPILVRKLGTEYEVIAGERRLKAARALNLEEIPVIIKTVTDREALVLALVENIQREELNAIEEAQGFKRLIEEFEFTQESVAQSVGKDRSTITNLLRLLRLPDEIQKSIFENKISVGHARALLSIEDKKDQKKIFERILSQGLSVREAERLTKHSSDEATTGGKLRKGSKDRDITILEEELQHLLGTKVTVQAGPKNKGKLIVEYYSLDDLDRILGILRKTP